MAELGSVETPPPSGSQPIEFRIGNYDVIRRIATGGMAEIFLAWQRGSGGFQRRVVLKRIHPHLALDPEFVEMFQNEARLAAALSHPNIVHVYDVLEGDAGELYIAMEYVRGESVQAILRQLRAMRMPLPLPYAVQIAMQTCLALEGAHTCVGCDVDPVEIIHRDVSPSNIFLSYRGQVKLLDFGIAKAMAHAEATQAGRLKGKYPYMSPEQFQGAPLDRRTDIFSLGAVLWEMTTGKRLYRGANEIEIAKKILNEPPMPPSAVVPDYPAELERIVLRCLERDRERRYSTAKELAADLEEGANAYDWTMKTATLGSFMSAIFAEKLEKLSMMEGDLSVNSGPISLPNSTRSAPRSTRSGPVSISGGSVPSLGSAPPLSVSGQRDRLPSLGSASASLPPLSAPPPFDPRQGASVLPTASPSSFFDRAFLALFALALVGSILFWTVIYPQMHAGPSQPPSHSQPIRSVGE